MILLSVLILTQLFSLSPHVRFPLTDTVHGNTTVAVLLTGEKRVSQGQVMAETLSRKNAQQIDPKAPLSAEDLVKLLMQYCNDRVGENVKDCSEKLEENVKHERNFTDDKLKTLAYHVNKRLNTLDDGIIKSCTIAEATNRQTTAQAERTTDIEKKLKACVERLDSMELATNVTNATQSEVIADLNLEIKTNSMYHEELLFNLKSGLQDALHLISMDIKSVWAKLLASPSQSYNPSSGSNTSCPACESTLLQLSNMRMHLESTHNQHEIFKCPECDLTLQSAQIMAAHIEEYHSTHEDSNKCASTFSTGIGDLVSERKRLERRNVNLRRHSEHQDDLSNVNTLYGCNVCGLVFFSKTLLKQHLRCYHENPAIPQILCYLCDCTFRNTGLLNIHMKDCHDEAATDLSTNVPHHACHVCDERFASHSLFSRHMVEAHNGRTTFSCNLCKNAHNQVMDMSHHLETSHIPHEVESPLNSKSAENYELRSDYAARNPVLESSREAPDNLETFSDIVQVDGNTTIPDEDDFTWVGVNSLQFPSIQGRQSLFESNQQNQSVDITMTDLSDPAPAAHSRDITYKYSLNSHNQARRLVTGAQKPPLSFTFNNIKTVNGIQYAHNVNIDFNSGVYLSAIKPVLETVNVGWSTELNNWVVTCTKMSNRIDNTSMHLLCTVLPFSSLARTRLRLPSTKSLYTSITRKIKFKFKVQQFSFQAYPLQLGLQNT